MPTFEERRDAALEDARLSGVAADQAEAAKDQIATAEASGDIDAEEARRRFAEAEEVVARHRREVDRLERLAAQIEKDRERHEADEARKRYETALQTAREAADEANKAAETLAQRLATAVKAVETLAKRREARKAAVAEARALCPDGVRFDRVEGEPDWLPDRDGLDALLEIVDGARKDAARASATRAAAEQGKRERAQTARKQLAKRYAWTGDEDVLAELRALDLAPSFIDETVAEAVKAHAAVRARAVPVVDKLLADVRAGRTSPRGALERLGRSPEIPDDLRAEAARELETAAGVAA